MKAFSYYSTDGLWWFRIFGYGLHGKNFKKHKLLFSERNGYRTCIFLGNWIFRILKAGKI